MMTYSLPVNHVYTLLKSRGVVPFLGSGASVSAGVATVSLVIKELAETINFPIGMNQTLQNISMVVEEFLGGRELLNETLHRVFSTKNAPTMFHKLIVMQRPRLVITTNYDNLIEEACRQEHIEHCVIATDLHGGHKGGMYLYKDGSSDKWRRHEQFPVENLNDNAVLIYKLHGTIDVNEKDGGYFLVSEEDYYYAAINTYLENIFPSMIKCELSEKHSLFLGYSMSDIHVRHVYRQVRLRDTESKNIAICYLPNEMTKLRYKRLFTSVYDVTADDFADLLIRQYESS